MIRLSSNRCFYGEPTVYDGRGRPRLHGKKFKLNDETTWSPEAQKVEVEHPLPGRPQIQAWHNLHFRQAPDEKLSLIRIQRLDSFTPKSAPVVRWERGKNANA